MTFEGFPDEGLVFYEGLEADNSKTYWTRHKGDYDAFVRKPLLAMLEELEPEFGAAKVFRPYRDVRFSNDKTPYKTHQGATVHDDTGRLGAWYVQVSADGLRVAGGVWRLESDQVDRYRRAVADRLQGGRLRTELDRLERAGFTVGGEKLTRLPRGYDVDDARAELLTHKSLSVGRAWPPDEWLHERKALEVVRDAWRELRAVNGWLADNVGPTTKEIRRR
jgi:uncharacterized protein (TIGR02453 family)